MTIDIPGQAVVIAIGGRRAPFAEILDRVPAVAVPWSVDRPEASADAVRAALAEHGRVRVAMPRAHPKAVQQAASIAKRHGARSVLLRLTDAPDVQAALDRVDAVHDVGGSDAPDFRVVPMPSDKRHLTGPFDFVGDVHGCAEELRDLLRELGHVDADGVPRPHSDGRTVVMLGDYTDRGPESRETLALVRALVSIGALALLGNHDEKLRRWLSGKDVRVAAGLATTIAEFDGTDEDYRREWAEWLGTLEAHYVLDGGRVVAAHAGLSEDLHGRHTPGAKSFALYGDPVEGGKALDEDGYPLARDWAQTYAGGATVVHGHVVHPEPRIVNGVVGIDTGVVFGGRLTAFRWPERDFVSVPARKVHFERRPDPAV